MNNGVCMIRIFTLFLFLCASLSADNFQIIGKAKKKTVDGVEVLAAKSMALKTDFPKGSDVLLSFEYRNESADILTISFSTNDELYSSLKGGEKVRTVDMIKLKKRQGLEKA